VSRIAVFADSEDDGVTSMTPVRYSWADSIILTRSALSVAKVETGGNMRNAAGRGHYRVRAAQND
jgi:hypothetical protein